MAGEDFQPLLKIGPFRKLDSKTAQVYTDPSAARSVSNADTARNLGSLMNCFGRSAFIDFPALSELAYVWRYDVSQIRPWWIVTDDAGTLFTYDLKNELISNIPGSAGPVNQAVESNGTMFLNNGQQCFVFHDSGYPGTPQQALQLGQWQYPAPTQGIYGYSVNAVSHSPQLDPGKYTYAFALVVTIPSIGGGSKQITAVTGGDVPYPYQVTLHKSDEPQAIEIDGLLSGVTAEGFSYKTAIYRMSSNVPVWYQVAIVDGSVYIDDNSDQDISGNPQMSFAGQQPPTGTGTPGPSGNVMLNPIAAYQDRMWVMAQINDSDTNNMPQTQVWYSNTGQPWNFDAVNQVLLLDDQQTSPLSTGDGTSDLPYGLTPYALVPLGGILLCFLSAQTWFINGSNETTYQPLQLFPDIGIAGPLAWVLGGGMVAWLSANGAGIWAYDGASLSYISQDIYNDLQAIPPTQWQSCTGGFADEQFFFSFPEAGVTFRYYLPTKEWTKLPYASPSFAYAPQMGSNPTPADSFKMNQLVAVRNGTFWLDAWLDGKENDLGAGIPVSWLSAYSDSGQPWMQKDYRWLGVSAPQQTGSVVLELFVDYNNVPAFTSKPIDLSSGFTTKFVQIPQDTANGFVCSLSVTFTTAKGATAPIEIWSAFVGGTLKRGWTLNG